MEKFNAQLEQFQKALSRLKEALQAPKSTIVRDSAIQRFEFTLDLAWKTLKTHLEAQKGIVCTSPKECFREAYRQGIIVYNDEWLDLVDKRNETVHTYNEEKAEQIFLILPRAAELFQELAQAMTT